MEKIRENKKYVHCLDRQEYMDTTWRHFILVSYPDRVMLITQSIDIKEFIDSKGFDPLLIEKSYYVAPEKKKKSGVGPVKLSKSNVYSLIWLYNMKYVWAWKDQTLCYKICIIPIFSWVEP